MWYVMQKVQQTHDLSERLIRAVSNWQVFHGADDDVEDLITRGADVNRQHGGLLPLHCACMTSDVYCLRLLLEKGARLNDIDGYGRTALHYAAENCSDCTEILLENGADVNLGDGNQDTPLHWSSFKGNLPCVEVLLRNGANPNLLDYNRDAAISWAAHKGHYDIVKLLLDYNATVDYVNLRGQSPITKSILIISHGLDLENDKACLELLIKASGHLNLHASLNRQILDLLALDNRLSETILPLWNNPRRLKDLCRATVRNSLGRNYLPNVAPILPLPSQLREYILLQR